MRVKVFWRHRLVQSGAASRVKKWRLIDNSDPWQIALDAAIALGKRRRRVFPLGKDRTPCVKDWPTVATSDEEAIRALWQGRSYAVGVGILTGEENTWVLDVDVKNGKRGNLELEKLITRHGSLPRTVVVRSGTDGFHYHFAPDLRIHSGASDIAPGLDVKGYRSFVVAPPTMNLETGKPYRWVDGHSFNDLQPAPAPEWLINLILAAKSNRSPNGARVLGTIIPKSLSHK